MASDIGRDLLLGALTGRLGVLTPDPQSPVVTKTPVALDLLHPLQVLTQLGVQVIRQDVLILAVHDVLLSVQEPRRNLELSRVLHDGDDPLELIGVQVSCPASEQYI